MARPFRSDPAEGLRPRRSCAVARDYIDAKVDDLLRRLPTCKPLRQNLGGTPAHLVRRNLDRRQRRHELTAYFKVTQPGDGDMARDLDAELATLDDAAHR